MVNLGRAASIVAVLTAASMLLGFGRDVVIAAVFGTSAALDAYFVAQGLMNVVLGLVAGSYGEGCRAGAGPGFDAEQAELATTLTRIVLVATVLIAGTNLLASAVQSHGRFGWSAFQGVPFNLTMIVAAGVFVVGSLTRLLVHLPVLRSPTLRVRLSVGVSNPGFLEMTRLVPAAAVGG